MTIIIWDPNPHHRFLISTFSPCDSVIGMSDEKGAKEYESLHGNEE